MNCKDYKDQEKVLIIDYSLKIIEIAEGITKESEISPADIELINLLVSSGDASEEIKFAAVDTIAKAANTNHVVGHDTITALNQSLSSADTTKTVLDHTIRTLGFIVKNQNLPTSTLTLLETYLEGDKFNNLVPVVFNLMLKSGKTLSEAIIIKLAKALENPKAKAEIKPFICETLAEVFIGFKSNIALPDEAVESLITISKDTSLTNSIRINAMIAYSYARTTIETTRLAKNAIFEIVKESFDNSNEELNNVAVEIYQTIFENI